MSSPDQTVTPQRLYLKDLYVGQRFTSGPFELDEEQTKAFARQFDPQPFHLDPLAAGESFFGGLAASGWHTAAITMRLLVEGLPIAGGLIGGGGGITWPRPTRPGAMLHVESEVVEVTPSRSRPQRGMALVRSETINQFGEVVQILISRLVIPRRTAPPQSQ